MFILKQLQKDPGNIVPAEISTEDMRNNVNFSGEKQLEKLSVA